MTHPESAYPDPRRLQPVDHLPVEEPEARGHLTYRDVVASPELIESVERLKIAPLEAGYETYLRAIQADGEGDLRTAVWLYEWTLRSSRAHVVEPDSARRGMEHECCERLVEIWTDAAANARVDGDSVLVARLVAQIESVRHPAARGSGEWDLDELLDPDHYLDPEPGQSRQ